MSEENVEVVNEFSQLFEAGDREAWSAYFDPEVVWDTSASELPEAGVYHGHAGIEEFFGRWLPTWTDYSVVTDEVIDAGDAVVVMFRQSGTGRGSGVRTERDFFGIYDLKDSKAIRFRLYESREEALKPPGWRSRPRQLIRQTADYPGSEVTNPRSSGPANSCL